MPCTAVPKGERKKFRWIRTPLVSFWAGQGGRLNTPIPAHNESLDLKQRTEVLELGIRQDTSSLIQR